MGSRYRNNLPQLGEEFFLTDGGMETDFVFSSRRGLAAIRVIPAGGDARGPRTVPAIFRTLF